MPTGAKVGIDATIGEGIPLERFERISYAYADRAKIADYLGGKADPDKVAGPGKIEEAAGRIVAAIEAEPMYYQDIADRFSDYDFQTIARALGALHEQGKHWQTAEGRMCVSGSKFAAKLPGSGAA